MTSKSAVPADEGPEVSRTTYSVSFRGTDTDTVCTVTRRTWPRAPEEVSGGSDRLHVCVSVHLSLLCRRLCRWRRRGGWESHPVPISPSFLHLPQDRVDNPVSLQRATIYHYRNWPIPEKKDPLRTIRSPMFWSKLLVLYDCFQSQDYSKDCDWPLSIKDKIPEILLIITFCLREEYMIFV